MIKVYLTSEPLNDKLTHYPEVVYKEASRWSIDNKGRLHLRDELATYLATFNRYEWTRVELVK